MTETKALTLAEFLTARIDEDEAAARAAVEVADKQHSWWVDGPGSTSGKWWVYATGENFQHRAIAEHIARQSPARVLAECEAKRRIIESTRDHGILRILLLPYAGHPDYDPAWRL